MVNIKDEFWKVRKWLFFSVNASLWSGKAGTKLHQTLPEEAGAATVTGTVGQHSPLAWQVQHSSVQCSKEKIG